MLPTLPNQVAYSETALGRAIKVVGIGKYMSKPLSADLIEECRQSLSSGLAHPLQAGAFIGALLAKGPTPEERSLETCFGPNAFSVPALLVNKLCPELPVSLLPIATKLVRGQHLRTSEAHQLGDYLFGDFPADQSCDSFRGLAVSILRVRHETNNEYEGLYKAAMSQLALRFQGNIPVGPSRPIVQLSEPFDGVEHSYLITPILAHFFQQKGYKALSMVGRSPGPKHTLNAHDLFIHLNCEFLFSQSEFMTEPPSTYGWVLDQKALSPALNGWVDRRRVLLKRPFLATLEKVLNPAHARILLTSVFHVTNQTKMAELALVAGFDAVLVLKGGLEGSLAPSTAQATGVLCAIRTPENHLFCQHFDADRPEFARFKTAEDDVINQVDAADNAGLVKAYFASQQTGQADFDNRVAFALALYGRGLEWIEKQWESAK